jgi:TolA-binding protein
MTTKLLSLGLFVMLLSSLVFELGCLQTRTDVKEIEQRQVIQQQVSTIQKSSADANSRYFEVEEQLRAINGRIEVVENQVARESRQAQTQNKIQTEKVAENSQKLNLLQEALVKLEQQQMIAQAEIATLRSENATLQAAMQTKGSGSSDSSKKNGSQSAYKQGQEQFSKKDWKRAILSYQKYREEHPKGKFFREATFQIGACFQELGLKDEATTFYKEVLAKYPKSDEAKKAKLKLKSLK